MPDDPGASRDQLQALADAGVTWWIESRWDLGSDDAEGLLALVRRGPPSL